MDTQSRDGILYYTKYTITILTKHDKPRKEYYLKEYYEIVDEARLLSGFFPTHAEFCLQKCIYNHETK